ncbi:hypothetical protein AQUCO_03500171v1, partial [Aquilegia coerulea]
LSANAQNMTLPGCLSSCGNISIPYPFGIGKGCYRNKAFEILCNTRQVLLRDHQTSSGTMAPYLGVTGHEIKELSLERLRILGPYIFNCYDQSGQVQHILSSSSTLNLSASPFTISNNENRLFAVGCDVVSYIADPDSNNSISDSLNASCFGIGCCQTTISRGLKTFELMVDSINTQARSWDSNFNGCSIAALLDGDSFDLYFESMGSQPDMDIDSLSTGTVALDWSYESCQDLTATNRSGILCGNLSECINSTTGFGYRCRCKQGYHGNPYLPKGCQDIDECKIRNRCNKGAICRNTHGSFTCVCPPGYYYQRIMLQDDFGCLPNDDLGKYGYGEGRLNKTAVVLIGVGVGVGLLLLLAVGFWLYIKLNKRKETLRKQKFFKKNGGLLLEQQISSGDGNVEKAKIFVQEELEKTTDNFNESRILGKGGSGTVYKGMLTDGRIVAIKKSKIVDESQTGQFINELIILSQINHRHVVKLLGCCLETEVPLLIYEYISNGTLSQHLHDDTLKSSISWEHRLCISIEIAGALSYLHSSASTPIFHRDIKSSNILLDEGYKATVSDFGISRSVPIEATHLTTLVQGTFGYLDPEYFHSGQFTDKSDVYSFGVVLVELLTGQKPISVSRSEEEKNLAMHFISLVKQDRLHEILETLVLNEAGKEEIFVVAKLAKRCLKLVGKKRPTMKEVMVELEGLRRHDREQPLIQQNYQFLLRTCMYDLC